MRLISSAVSFVLQPVGARRRWALVAALSLLADSAGFAQSEVRVPKPESPKTVSFRNDVIAVLSKAGCNAGACHGNKTGKGGFKLSLRGQDPDLDYLALTHDLFARRTNPMDPDRSLMLLKPTAQIAHEGGQRFRTDSMEYRILRRWIELGTPPDGAGTPGLVRLEVTPQQQVLVEPADQLRIKATAIFSDGSRRDVSN